ncbi:flagellar hook-associated protein FlgK [Oceanisphaera avium]|uniref:Flagellar hook-associated protein 1 n=1 Tax=Oceanisphaera avium TaxID=1903694 RepID=A0A1Y0CY14_9GAMM|nr:flagellar hook-associated protein FlgK [Oceanisphaera avium]ART79745.1 flagellar hook-associated protein FlgK [Oceanisphaera avium]
MAVDIYQTGVSGLLAAQGQLATTGHNIANVNTEGYSRQRVEQVTTLPMYHGAQFYGTGTRVTDVTRMYQEYAFRDVLINNTEQAGAEALYNHLSFLDQSLTGVNKGIASSLDDMYKAINAVADNPGNLGNRDLMLSNAHDLTNHFNEFYSALDQEMVIKNRDIQSRADHVTTLANGIAELNQEIFNAGQNGSPNDLMDQRDRLIQELGKEVKVTTLKGDNGMVSVMLGGREPLVSGNQAYGMEVRPGSPDPQQTELYITQPGKPELATRLKGSLDLGGEMGALFHYRDQVLGPNLSDMGKVAIGIADAYNQVQKQGVDLNGEPGKNFFTDINDPQAQKSRFLSSNSNIDGSVTISDTSKLTGGEYTLKYYGGDYMLTDVTNGKTFAIDAADVDTSAAPEQTINLPDLGFSITLSEAPNTTDEMVIRPTRQGGVDLQVDLNSGDQIAASGTIMVAANKDNTGTGKVGVNLVEPTPPAAAIPTADYPLSVKVVDDGTAATPPVLVYEVYKADGTALGTALTPDAEGNITFGDVQMNIKGTPAEFDQFVVKQAKGSGNNSNALAFADIQNKKWLDNGKSTVTDSLNKTAVEIGGITKNQKIRAQAAEAAYNQSYDRMLATSGVNLDEEAANLLRFQQSYMASARVVTVASETMNTLLQIR